MSSQLFKELQANSIWDAQLVGKNLFCKSPNDVEVFTEYFNFCIKIARYPIELETRIFYANEAELALSVFSEKTDIDNFTLLQIQNKRSELVAVSNEINTLADEQQKQSQEVIVQENNAKLSSLSKLSSKLSATKTKKEFDSVLAEISEYENALDKPMFTDRQTILYNSLTNHFSELVSNKMNFLSVNEDIEYNKKAAIAFREAFNLFKKDESKYKEHDSVLYGLVATYLFAYDAKRLFNETLIYYNHVYSYIFNKLDDDGKFRFTQYSFDTKKIYE